MMVEKLRAEVPIAQLAQEYEPTAQTLYQWRRELESSGGDAAVHQAEVRRLKQRVRRLEEDNQILEKAAIWFARAHEAELRS